MVRIIICLILGYVFGCFSTGYFVGKWNHIDIRNYGSGNSGTTNALRTLGFKAAVFTFLGDTIKAIIPIMLVRYLFPASKGELQLLLLYTGLGAVLGHNYPVWLRFKGGKGIAATAGVMLAFDWRFGLAAAILFFTIVGITRYVSLGSLALSLLFPIGILIFYPGNVHMLIISLIFTILAYVKHRENIVRLIHGKERKLGEKVDINK